MYTLSGYGWLQEAIGGSPDGGGNLPPTNLAPPEIVGKAEVGATISARPGLWAGLPVPHVRTTLFIDGAARQSPYVLGPNDDRKEVFVTDIAANSAGGAVMPSPSTQVRYAAPRALQVPGDVSISASGETVVVDVGRLFVGATGGQWSAACMADEGAVQVEISESGRLTLNAGALAGSSVVSVAYANSGGSSSANITVFAVGADKRPNYDGSLQAQQTTLGSAFDLGAGRAFTGEELTFSATGLAPGLAIDAVTGRISGIPSGVGELTVEIAATNAAGSASGTLSLIVSGPAVIAPTYDGSLQAAVATIGVAVDLAAGGAFTGAGMAFSATGLAPGLAIDPASGRISGIPSVMGDFAIEITATNAVGSASGTLLLMVAGPAVIAPSYDGSLQAAVATVGVAFDLATGSAFAGAGLAFSATGLTPGLAIDAATGRIGGIPSRVGDFFVQITASNAGGSASGTLRIVVAEPASVVADAPSYDAGMDAGLGPWPTGEAISYATSQHASGGDLTYAITGLPAGLSFSVSTGVISGTPTAAGTFPATWTVRNSGGSVSTSFDIAIGRGVGVSAAVTSNDLAVETNSAVLDIGVHDAERQVWATVMAGGTQVTNFAINGGPLAARNQAYDGFTNRAVEFYEVTGATGTTIAAAWGGDTEHVATFRTIGLRPLAAGAIVVGRQVAANATSTILGVTVPAGGALLLHGKRYSGVSSDGPEITTDETLNAGIVTGVRAVWYNDTGNPRAFNVTFTTSISQAEKYGLAVLMERQP